MNEPDTLQSLNEVFERNVPYSENIDNIEQKGSERFKAARERAKIHFNNREYTNAIEMYSYAVLECEKLCGYVLIH